LPPPKPGQTPWSKPSPARAAKRWRNVYEVTEEFYVYNGHYGTREDVVFLINGIPVLVIECKNATKNEAIALGVD
jgi:type I restriction enzyme, R subunit